MIRSCLVRNLGALPLLTSLHFHFHISLSLKFCQWSDLVSFETLERYLSCLAFTFTFHFHFHWSFANDQILSGEKPWSTASPDQPSLWIKHRGSHCSDIQGLPPCNWWEAKVKVDARTHFKGKTLKCEILAIQTYWHLRLNRLLSTVDRRTFLVHPNVHACTF